MHLLIIALVAALLFGLTKMAIFAVLAVAAIATATTAVDLGPLINGIVVPLLAPILGAAALWLAYRLQSVFHLHVLDGRRALLETAINNGIALVAAQLQRRTLSVNVPDHVASVVGYAAATVPGAIKKLGIDPAQLGQKVAAEIAKASAAG